MVKQAAAEDHIVLLCQSRERLIQVLFRESNICDSRGRKNELCLLQTCFTHIHCSDFRLWKGLGENTGVTTFKAAAFQNAQRLVSLPTIRSGESLPECAYESNTARIRVRMVWSAVLIRSALE